MERTISNILNTRNFLVNTVLVLGRPWNGFIIAIIAILGYLINSGTYFQEIILLSGVFFLTYLGGATLNDVFDYEIDKINMPYRPLQKKVIDKKTAIIYAIILFVISGILAFNNLILFSGYIIFSILALAYSVPPIRLVRRGALANITLAVVTVLIPGMTGAILSPTAKVFDSLILFTFLTFGVFGVLVLKDFKDVKGDLLGNKKTIVILVGKEKALTFSRMLVFTYLPLTSFSFLLFNPNIFFLIVGTAITFAIMFKYLSISSEKLDDIKQAENIFSKTRIGILFYISIILISLFFNNN